MIIANNLVARPYRQIQNSNIAVPHVIFFDNVPKESRIFLLTIRNPIGGDSKTLIFSAMPGEQMGALFEVRANDQFLSSMSNIPMRLSARFLRTSGSGTTPPPERFSSWHTVYRHHEPINLNSGTTRSSGVTGGQLDRINQSIDFPKQGNQNILMRSSTNFTQNSTTLGGADRSVTASASLSSFHGSSLGNVWETWNNANRFNSNTGNVEIRLHTGLLNLAQNDGNRFDRILGRVMFFEWEPEIQKVVITTDRLRRLIGWNSVNETTNTTNLEYILEVPY